MAEPDYITKPLTPAQRNVLGLFGLRVLSSTDAFLRCVNVGDPNTADPAVYLWMTDSPETWTAHILRTREV